MNLKESLPYKMLCSIWVKFEQRKDRKLGVDFSTWESNEQIGINPSCGNQYQPSTNGLTSILKKLPIGKSDAIIDIGCGKGKAMYIMSKFPFAKIDGIDLSDRLCEIASGNLKCVGCDKSKVIQADAATFREYDRYNYFYVFNSFPATVFEKMLSHILDSISRKPRKVFFIYLNPECHDLLEKSEKFYLMFSKKSFIQWFQYNCYTNEL